MPSQSLSNGSFLANCLQCYWWAWCHMVWNVLWSVWFCWSGCTPLPASWAYLLAGWGPFQSLPFSVFVILRPLIQICCSISFLYLVFLKKSSRYNSILWNFLFCSSCFTWEDLLSYKFLTTARMRAHTTVTILCVRIWHSRLSWFSQFSMLTPSMDLQRYRYVQPNCRLKYVVLREICCPHCHTCYKTCYFKAFYMRNNSSCIEQRTECISEF